MILRLAFMGASAFSVPALDALVRQGHEVEVVYTQPPRAAGRGKRETPTPVHIAAEKTGIPVRHPRTLRSEPVQAAFRDLRLDAAVVVAYGTILPKPILMAPRLGCLNIHASLLPRWRGAAPIQRAILAGDTETGVSILQMDEGLDTGPVLLEKPVPIYQSSTARSLHDELSFLGARLIVETLERLTVGSITPMRQEETRATYAEKLTKAEGRIDFTAHAGRLDRQVRALTPWPGCFFEYGGERIKLIHAHPNLPGKSAKPGTILDTDGTVACGTGALTFERVQRPGRDSVAGADFLRGLRLMPGDVLG